MVDTVTTAWVNAVVAAGGSVSAGRTTTVDNFIVGAKADGFWSKFDRIWLHAAANTPSATIDLVANDVAVLTNVTPVVDTYIQSFQRSGYYITYPGYDVSTAAQYSQNAANITFWGHLDYNPGDATIYASASIHAYARYSDNQAYGRVNESSSGGYVVTDSVGFHVFNRSGSSAQQFYKYGERVGINAAASGAVGSATFIVVLGDFSFCGFGSSLTAADQRNLYLRLLDYRADLFGITESDTDVRRWMAAVRVLGGTISAGRQTSVHNLVTSLKSHGIWSKLDRLQLFAATDAPSAVVDVKNAFVASLFSSPTFTADRGFTGNGSSAYIYVGNLTQATNFAQNSGCIFAWNNTNVGEAAPIFAQEFVGNIRLFPQYSDTNTYWALNSAGGSAGGIGASNIGLWSLNRSGASAEQLYKNGTSVATGSASSTAVGDTRLFVLSEGLASFSTRQVSCFGVASSLDATEQANLNTDLRAYLTDVGVIAPSGITLPAAGGSYALTGTAAAFLRKQTAATGSYIITGTAAGFARKQTAAAGSYALTGSPAVFVTGTAPATGTLAVSEAADTSSATGSVAWSGVLAAADARDVAAFAGQVIAATGTLTATDAIDTAAMTGSGVAAAATGTLVVTEAIDTAAMTGTAVATGTLAATDALDQAAITGKAVATGTLVVTEAIDLAAFTGGAVATGTMTAPEQLDTAAMTATALTGAGGALLVTEAPDTLAATGTVAGIGGTLAATELALDTAAATGSVAWSGTMSASDARDTAALTGTASWSATVAASEAGDSASGTGTVNWSAVLAAIEAKDTAAAVGTVAWLATLTATEAKDTASFPGTAAWLGTLAASEARDAIAITGQAVATGTLAVSEAPDVVAFGGFVVGAGLTGFLVATEAADVAALAGQVTGVLGSLAVSEVRDVSSSTGTAGWSGTLAASEVSDTAVLAGQIRGTGTLAASEAADTASMAGKTGHTGTLAVSEARDTFAAAGQVTNQPIGYVAATEAPDLVVITGGATATGTLAASELRDLAEVDGYLQQPNTMTAHEAADRASFNSGKIQLYSIAGGKRPPLAVSGRKSAPGAIVAQRNAAEAVTGRQGPQ